MSQARHLTRALRSGMTFIATIGGPREVDAALQVRPLSAVQVQKAVGLVKPQINLDGYKLTKTGLVEHSFGDEAKPAEVALIRFERADGVNTGIGGEHVSATVDLTANKVMGLTHMQAQLAGGKMVSREDALNRAARFLHQAAPDLMPAINAHKNLEKNFGNLEVHWVHKHDEELVADGRRLTVSGMKVKTHMPKEGLWAWVILDKNGDVQTFERNISWDFAVGGRGTQKWLHDSWLQKNDISLFDPPNKEAQASMATVMSLPIPSTPVCR